jgi:hypothetical protein
MFYYLYSLNGVNFNQLKETYFLVLTIFLGSQIFLLEITRKIRPKELEIPSRDTYTAQYGVVGASILIFCVCFITFLSGIFLERLSVKGINIIYFIPLLLILFSLLIFNKKPNIKNSKIVIMSSIAFVFLINIMYILSLFKK